MNNELTRTEPAQDKDIMLVNEGVRLFQNAPAILKANQLSVSRAREACNKFIEKYNANGFKLNEDLDREAQALLIKVKETVAKLKGQREPITQIFDAIKKMFTELEKKISVTEVGAGPYFIQQYRNEWAKWLIEETERKRQEAERKAEVDKQKAELVGWILTKIGELLSMHLFSKKQSLMNSFNTITLENFYEKQEKLAALNTIFSRNKLDDILKYPTPVFPKLSIEDQIQCKMKAHDDYDFDAWIRQHDAEMAELKQQLIDRLPSKRQELEEVAEAERKRREEERQRKAEERQAAIAKANAKEKARLEEEARRQREEDAKRNEELKREQERLAAERLQREKEEAERLQKEKEESDRKAREAAELASASMTAASLFDQVANTADVAPAPESRSGFDIKVKHHAGWVEIFQFWYQKDGVKLNVEDMGKKSLNQMKKFAEDTAKKTGERIESKYLEYATAVKAVNRKEKV